MKCFECGGALDVRRENHKYPCGLPYVTLAGIEVRHCRACGDTEYVIPQIEALHRSIAHFLIAKARRLTGAEVRFLRKFIGWSGADFARHFGVRPETISRWEAGKQDMGPVAERLLRLAVAHWKQVDEYPMARMEAISEGAPKPLHLEAKRAGKDWELAVV